MKMSSSDKAWERLTGVLSKNIHCLTPRRYAADIQQKSQFLKKAMALGLVRSCTLRSLLGFFLACYIGLAGKTFESISLYRVRVVHQTMVKPWKDL